VNPQAPTPVTAEPVVTTTRFLPVPRERVFEAFSRPEQLARWWGPKGFTNTFHEFDLRPGGRWRFDMRSPGGDVYPQDKRFVEVVASSRIVLAHPQEGHNFRLTLVFEDAPGGTWLTWHMRFATEGELAPVRDAVLAGNEQNLDRLEAHLQVSRYPEASALTLERVLMAPRESVFRAWTDPQHVKRWWAPEGATTPHCSVDLRVGGRLHYCMRFADGNEMWGLGIFQEVAAPARLAFLDSFADAEGNPVPPERYGMSTEHPVQTLVTIDFEALGPTSTRITLRHHLPSAFPERDGVQQGWTEMLARLSTHLET